MNGQPDGQKAFNTRSNQQKTSAAFTYKEGGLMQDGRGKDRPDNKG